MNDSWNVSQYCEENVDEEISVAASFEKDTKRRQEDGKDDFADV